MAFDSFPEQCEPVAGPASNAAVAETRPSLLGARRGLAARRPERVPSSRRRATDEALQRQAGVLAHDFNNLLGVILCASEALAAQLPEGSEGRELAQLSQEAAERGSELLRRLLDLSRPDAVPETVCDAAEAARAAARQARLATSPSVSVEVDVTDAALPCAADRTALESALLNLCVNAGHAMPAGGVIRVCAEQSALGETAAEALGLPPGDYLALSVRDTGVGMSPEILARAVEPYFTTRQGRGGTGLGLSGVDAFARRAGGRLVLQSQVGQGTTATLYLPRT